MTEPAPLPQRLPRPFVNLLRGQITIDGVTICDPQVIASAQRWIDRHEFGADLAGWLHQTLELAARIEAATAPSAELSAQNERLAGLQRSLVDSVAQLETRITTAVQQTAGSGGTLPAAIGAHLDQLEADLAVMFDAHDGPLRSALTGELSRARQELVAEIARNVESQTRLVHQMLAPDGPASPLRAVLDQQKAAAAETAHHLARIEEHLTTLREAAAAAAGHNKSPAKGAVHEASIQTLIERIAHATGDDCEATGRVAGQNGATSWVGDHVITVADPHAQPRPRIVLESKAQKLSAARWISEAQLALTNRTAHAYIGIVANPTQVPSGGQVALLRANIVIIHQPPSGDDSLLVAVIRLMRAQAITAADRTHQSGDSTAAAAKLREAVAGLTEIEKISKKASTIRNSANSIDELTTSIRARIETAIGEALRLLHGERRTP